MAHLFEEFPLRGLTLPHRIIVSPMCQYSSPDGAPTDWHMVHLGSRAIGGAAVVFTEATAVSPEGRISDGDTGIWNDAQTSAWRRITGFLNQHGSYAGIQLAHAGRKASTGLPSEGGKPLKGARAWTTLAPSAIPFTDEHAVPQEMSAADIQKVVTDYEAAARRSLNAGFQIVEIHAAHGYLLHEFYSPLSNHRTDAYGGSFENRIRLLCEVTTAVRAAWPQNLPVFVRVSASDWVDGAWSVEDTIALARRLKELSVDLLDCSSGGNAAKVPVFAGFGYQTQFAERVRRETGLATGAVGMIVSASQADHIIRSGQADTVFMAREMLRDPYFPMHAAKELGHKFSYPEQYLRAGPDGSVLRKPIPQD